jgi:hypothetical protein
MGAIRHLGGRNGESRSALRIYRATSCKPSTAIIRAKLNM